MGFVGLLVVEDAGSGRDRRLPSRTFALEHVANRPIAHHALDVLRSGGVDDVVVASSAEQAAGVRECLGERADEERLRLRYLECPGGLDLAGAFRLAAPVVGDAPCIAHLAGGLLGEPVTPLLDGVRSSRPDVVLFMYQRPAPDRRLSAATQQMLHIAELHPNVASLGIAGVWVFGRRALQHVAAAAWSDGTELDLTKIADPIAAVKGNLHVRLVDTWCRYAGDPADLLELNRSALDRLPVDGHRPDNSRNRIEGRVHIHESACVRSSVIVGPALIGPDAHITDAYIGPYTSIGRSVRIANAEIERSIVGAGASITHVGARLIASVIGRDSRIFRDFGLPRALRLRIGEGTEVALC
jgi:glucose-1-phosphate thymidylyltransferase